MPLHRAILGATLVAALAGTAAAQTFDLAARQQTHWAWQPLAATAPPLAPGEGDDAAIDAFVRARLADAGLEPAPAAAPHALLRRLWLDLVGLPPPSATVREFVADPSDAAYDRQIDALLASPQFGERWARHWLDLVRYAETLGHEYDFPIANAWRYRDYVIRALNADLPYDQFLTEHVAGDLLAAPRRNAAGENESVQATAAWWFVEQTHSPVDARQHQADRIDNQIDVLGKAMLGMTVACARCHDHKFDAISQADYYSLFGFVESSRYVQAPIAPCDPASAGYRAALQAQRDVAHAFAEAAAPLDPEWQALAATGPERWSASGGFGPLRAEDRLIATADEPDAGAPGSGWMRVNDGFGAEPWRGPWCPDPAADNATLLALPGAFWHSGIAGRRREGTLQTATFELRERYLHVRAAGVHSRIVVIVDGFHVVRDPIYGDLHRTVDDPGAHWLTFDLDDYRGHSVFVQCIDQVAHDLGDPVHERGSSWPDDGWLAVQAVVASALAEPPPADPGLALPQLPWTDTPAAVRSALDRLATAAAALPAPSATLPALSDGSGRDEFLYIRGNHRTKGPLQHRRFLTALAGDEAMPIDRGSGRLQLAAAILAPDNPLPSRTLVNRVWHHLFGRGLVRSVDNLGVLGDPPTHPALLDWLARDFVAHGWSLKHVIRRVVRSDTYRQSSRQTAAGEAIDPANRLIHRQNVRRLEAEAVRDTLLAVSGRLDPTLYGPSVPIALDNLEHARGKPKRSGPVDGEGRRSIYLAIRRNFMPAMLWAFDLPTPFAPVGRRSVSNVPAQALTLLNDPFVHEMCTRWAAGLLADRGADDDAALVQRAWLTALARQPRVDELEQCSAFLAAAAFEYDCEDDPSDPRPFADLLHGLVNTKEFTFRR